VTARTALTKQPRVPEHSGVEAVSFDRPRGSNANRSHSRADSTSEVERICQTFYQLDGIERARVLQALSVPAPDRSLPPGRGSTSRSRIVCFLALCCLGLIPWTIGLAVTLPRTYLVDNWPLAWVGFDAILLGCLGTTAWALWKQRHVAIVTSMITSVLLLCDAWFDVITAHSGRCLVLSITTAVFGEIPIGVLLGLISIRLLYASREAVDGHGSSPISLWRVPLGWPAPSRGSHLLLVRHGSRGPNYQNKASGMLSSRQRGEQQVRH
jgi:hypothetical protein